MDGAERNQMSLLSNIEKAIATAQVTAASIHTALETASKLESLVPISGAGAQKLDLVLTTVKTAYEPAYQIIEGIDVGKIEAFVKVAVSAFVSLANAVGIFRKPAA